MPKIKKFLKELFPNLTFLQIGISIFIFFMSIYIFVSWQKKITLTTFSFSLFFSLSYLLLQIVKEPPKNLKNGKEYGSARWGTREEILPYMDVVQDNNHVLSMTECLSMNSKIEPWYVQRNKNVVVVGGSGSGKTRYFIKPNIMQMNASFVVTDPKGTVLNEVGEMLLRGSPKIKRLPLTPEQRAKGQIIGKPIYEKRGEQQILQYERTEKGKLILEPYKIKVLNLINFLKSMRYNPFKYIRKECMEKDIFSFVTTLINNTKGEGDKSGEDFWVKAEKLLFMALVAFILEVLSPEEQNITSLLLLINSFEIREEDEQFKDAVDRIFEDYEKRQPNSFAVLQYKKYKLAAGKTAKSILISCAARLAPFEIQEVRDLLSEDELDFDKMGEEKTALFVIIPDSDATFNFIAAILYTQMFNLLLTKADDVYDGSLPIHIRFLLDEFANSVTRSTPKTVGITDKSVA